MTRRNLSQEVYDLISKVPSGKVTTYGAVARELNVPRAPRAVGAILRANPHPIKVPCHRVIMSNGELGGYGGKNGTERKAELLKKEGVRVKDGRVNLSLYLFDGF
ncbi:MAG: MGMT family protein [Thaumarchaeota archaeon]|nr:MGMT family protein [Nitrososphaerota archaeon]